MIRSTIKEVGPMLKMLIPIFVIVIFVCPGLCMDEETEKEFGITDVAPFKSCESLKYDQVEIITWKLISSSMSFCI